MKKENLLKPMTDAQRQSVYLKPSDFLIKIGKEVKQDPTRWTQLNFARRADGTPVTSWEPSARCWCIEGFIERDLDQAPDEVRGKVRKYLLASRHTLKRKTLHAYNDFELLTSSDFLSWLRRAVTLARKDNE